MLAADLNDWNARVDVGHIYLYINKTPATFSATPRGGISQGLVPAGQHQPQPAAGSYALPCRHADHSHCAPCVDILQYILHIIAFCKIGLWFCNLNATKYLFCGVGLFHCLDPAIISGRSEEDF